MDIIFSLIIFYYLNQFLFKFDSIQIMLEIGVTKPAWIRECPTTVETVMTKVFLSLNLLGSEIYVMTRLARNVINQ
jgi:hypothetical protein